MLIKYLVSQEQPEMQPKTASTAKLMPTNSSPIQQPTTTGVASGEVDKPINIDDTNSHRSTSKLSLTDLSSSTSSKEGHDQMDLVHESPEPNPADEPPLSIAVKIQTNLVGETLHQGVGMSQGDKILDPKTAPDAYMEKIDDSTAKKASPTNNLVS